MDIIFRLRFLLWIFVLGLWGALAYEFLQDELGYRPPQLTTLRSPFPAAPPPGEVRASPGPLPSAATAPRPAGLSSPLPLPPAGGVPAGVALATAPRPAPPPRRPAAARPHRDPAERTVPGPAAGVQPKAPAGFETARTAHFVVFCESEAPPRQFLEMLEELHANLMLDLAAFAPWAREERVTLYLFQTQAAYQKFTGRPAWSGGSSSVERRTLYLYKSNELAGILAHELTHLYFDSFFAGGKGAPLWLSEGMATYIQIQRGLAAPNWIRPNIERLQRGKGYALKEMLQATTLTGISDASVRLWYTQAYSLVRFLIRSKWFVSYYQFCKGLRDARPMSEALYRAYGMPYNRLSALEHAWRFDLRTHELSGLTQVPTTTE